MIITSSASALCATFTFALNAIVIHTPVSPINQASRSTLLRISPLICIYEMVWDCVTMDIYATVEPLSSRSASQFGSTGNYPTDPEVLLKQCGRAVLALAELLPQSCGHFERW